MRVITLLFLIGAAIAAPSANAPRIVGGTDADIRDYPYMVAIVINLIDWEINKNLDELIYCGGSLITTRSVLTAAHCYTDTIPMWRWDVRLGSNYWKHGGDLYSVQSVVVHPGYRITHMYHDLAIMKLATPAVLSDRVGLARIAGPNYFIPDNTTVTAIGWGQLHEESPPSEILQQVNVLTINHDICRENYAELQSLAPQFNIPNVTSEMVCAGILGVGGKDSCSGDSGGPLLHQGVIVGITSWGHECAHPSYPGVYVNVPSYTSWIVDNA